MSHHESRRTRHQRRAVSAADFFWMMFFIILLVSVLLPSLMRARELAKRAVCTANLRGLMQAQYVYANDNLDWFAHHYYTAAYGQTAADVADNNVNHGVRWQGTMGSHDFLKISEPTTPNFSPQRSHPSRSLFLLVINGMCTPKQFICPASYDVADDLRNYGPDAQGMELLAAQPGYDRFDFRGYSHLSYGYQLPYGPKGRPTRQLDPRMPIMADKGPYFADEGSDLPNTLTSTDVRSNAISPTEAVGRRFAEAGTHWRPFNSRNHSRQGQNVAFKDGHVEWCKLPTVGVNNDNIYTIQTGPSVVEICTGLVPDANDLRGPLTNTDSFIVP